ncbi:hypothetical protein [Paramicrobacterium fandaimingii]|uniref:hypothetical protein n=1 Tax=Paramicrobacterium fandaimingii TaxID=2708079 RepID=UPI001422C440|nr:hypothetical protein [Microbacterium fandaimingii]
MHAPFPGQCSPAEAWQSVDSLLVDDVGSQLTGFLISFVVIAAAMVAQSTIWLGLIILGPLSARLARASPSESHVRNDSA